MNVFFGQTQFGNQNSNSQNNNQYPHHNNNKFYNQSQYGRGRGLGHVRGNRRVQHQLCGKFGHIMSAYWFRFDRNYFTNTQNMSRPKKTTITPQ